MNSHDYIKEVSRTRSHSFNPISRLILHGAIGCCTEAGELIDIVKKAMFYGIPVDDWLLIEEMGDMFWYLGLICDSLGISFEEVMDKNIKKLEKRYPTKFTTIDEQNRDYEAEKKAAHNE